MATASVMVTINGGLITSGGASLTGGQAYTHFFGFGDSNIDSGYYFTHPISNNAQLEALYQQSVQAGGGIPTDPGSQMNSEILAQDIGATAIPYGEAGGTNFAASSATVSGKLSNSSLAPSIQTQIETYLQATGNVADPAALYLISGGGNDSTVANRMDTQAEASAYMAGQADKLATSIGSLYAAGARNFLIDDDSGPGALKASFNNRLWADLAQAGIPFLVDDTSGLIRAIDANPAPYGITNTVQPPEGPFSASNPYSSANGGSVINPDPSLINAGWARYGVQEVSSTAAATYLWADDEHLSGAGQKAEAAYDFNVLQNAIPLPSETFKATSIVFGEGSGSQSLVTYQWQRDHAGQAWTDIVGAVTSSYTVTTSDIGDQLRVEVSFAGLNGDTGSAVSPATYAVACYCIGTHILTTRGEIPVQALRVGDIALTASGDPSPIRWIGYRTIDCTRHPDRPRVWPVRVRAGAFGEAVPARDLWMSPGHCVFVEGVLVPIRSLINESSVAQVPVDEVSYWHVELDGHRVILAEGLPTESYLDTGNRSAFENGGPSLILHPDFEPAATARNLAHCARVTNHGPEVRAARARLAARVVRLGHATTADHDLHVVADGRRHAPIVLGPRRYAFAISASFATAVLTSRTFVPWHTDPKSRDSRVLGVSVKRLQIDGEVVDLATLSNVGWHGMEQRVSHTQRWTDGQAPLPKGTRLVIVDLAGDGRYWAQLEQPARRDRTRSSYSGIAR